MTALHYLLILNNRREMLLDNLATIELLADRKGLSQEDITLISLASAGGFETGKGIKAKAVELGVKEIQKWNLSMILKRAEGKVASIKGKWKLLGPGQARVSELGFSDKESRIVNVAKSLRSYLNSLKHGSARYQYVEEAISGFEAQLYRSAIVFSWVGGFEILKQFIFDKKKSEFENAYNSRHSKNSKLFSLKSIDSFERIKEREVIEISENIGLFGKSVKDEIIECLNRRNRAGHPNKSLNSENIAAAHIETLLNQVFTKF